VSDDMMDDVCLSYEAVGSAIDVNVTMVSHREATYVIQRHW